MICQDADGALSESELMELFSTSPGNPWMAQGFPDGTLTADGKVTLQGVNHLHLCIWTYAGLLISKRHVNLFDFCCISCSPLFRSVTCSG